MCYWVPLSMLDDREDTKRAGAPSQGITCWPEDKNPTAPSPGTLPSEW